LIAIPTTAGTGSEATFGAVITDTENHFKFTVKHQNTAPKIALVDPKLTLSMPPALTASTGMDALTHAIEGYTAVVAEPLADANALYAIELITKFLKTAVFDGENLEARAGMLLGSLLAGIAFSNASVALVHGMSRPIGANFHVPHGVSNAALLGPVMDFSLVGSPDRYRDIALAMGEKVADLTDMDGAKCAAKAVKDLIADLQIPTLSKLGVSRRDLDKLGDQMAKDAIASGSPGNNPRKASKEEIVAIYYEAL